MSESTACCCEPLVPSRSYCRGSTLIIIIMSAKLPANVYYSAPVPSPFCSHFLCMGLYRGRGGRPVALALLKGSLDHCSRGARSRGPDHGVGRLESP